MSIDCQLHSRVIEVLAQLGVVESKTTLVTAIATVVGRRGSSGSSKIMKIVQRILFWTFCEREWTTNGVLTVVVGAGPGL